MSSREMLKINKQLRWSYPNTQDDYECLRFESDPILYFPKITGFTGFSGDFEHAELNNKIRIYDADLPVNARMLEIDL